MKGLKAAVVPAILLLAGCNTNDALIPRENVGTGAVRTSPVTQEDTNRLVRSPAPETATVSGRALPAPQNTLEAQARALESGASVSPTASPPLPDTAPPAAGAPPAAPQTTAQPAARSETTIRFLPIIGAPVQAVTPLSRQLGASARAAGLTIKSTSDAGAEHVLKGYLSAFADGGKISVTWVWDVLDASGARLNRIQGQETVPASGPDPWAAVPAATMEAIGQKTISAYTQWLQNGRG